VSTWEYTLWSTSKLGCDNFSIPSAFLKSRELSSLTPTGPICSFDAQSAPDTATAAEHNKPGIESLMVDNKKKEG